MRVPEPFIFEPEVLPGRKMTSRTQTGTPVTVVQAAELAEEHGVNDHDFIVNSSHESPSLEKISAILKDLRLSNTDGDAYLLLECIIQAHTAGLLGCYGVGATLGSKRGQTIEILSSAMNARQKNHPKEYLGHAETILVDAATPYYQRVADHSNDVAAVNLSPCPGCIGPMIDMHIPEVVYGTIDPQVGVAFLEGRDLRLALGRQRKEVLESRGLNYRFANIADPQLRDIMCTLCWDVFHITRSKVHRREHAVELKE